MKRILGFLILGLLLTSIPAWAAVYEIDPAHSSVEFKIKHLLSNTRGNFDQFQGTVDYEPGKTETWKTEATIKTTSINTKSEARDKHLRGADFFDVEKFPEIKFTSTKVTMTSETAGKLEGTLSMHGVEKPVTLDLEVNGVTKDPWGGTRAAFSATTKINRKDFGIIYNKTLETGGLLIGEEVTITLEIEAVEKKPEPVQS